MTATCFALLGCMIAAAHAAPPPSSDRAVELRRAIAARVAGTKGIGIAAGWIDGAARGTTSAGPVNAQTLFEIGSVTKTFTAELLADMIERHEVQAGTPITKLLPAGVHAPAYDGNEITLGDLATQTSGLPRLPTNINPRDINNPYAEYTTTDLYAFLNGYTLTRAPGSVYEYSNLGFALLGQLLARRANTSYEELLGERILHPLRMTSSTLNLPRNGTAQIAAPHDADDTVTEHWTDLAFSPAGALYSNVRDMLKYLALNMSDASTTLANASRLAQTPRHAGAHGQQVGFAWNVTADGRYIWHNGATGGYWAFIGFDRRSKRGIVVLTNRFSSIDDIAWHFLDPSKPLAPPEPEINVPGSILDGYAGTYRDDAGKIVVHIRRVPRGLAVTLPESPDALLHAASTTEFFLRSQPVRFTFATGAGGSVSGVTITQGNTRIVLHREAHSPM